MSCSMDIVTGVGVLDKAMLVIGAVADSPCNLTDLQTQPACQGQRRTDWPRRWSTTEYFGVTTMGSSRSDTGWWRSAMPQRKSFRLGRWRGRFLKIYAMKLARVFNSSFARALATALDDDACYRSNRLTACDGSFLKVHCSHSRSDRLGASCRAPQVELVGYRASVNVNLGLRR